MSRKTSSTILFTVLVALRKAIEKLQDFADWLDRYLDSAKEDTYEIVDLTIDKTQQITEKIELSNFIKLLAFLTVILVFVTMFMSSHSMSRVIFYNNQVDVSVILISFLLLMANIFYFGWQALLIFHYKPFEAVPHDKLPTCTVLIPAYNEGSHVSKTLKSVLDSDYPAHRLEIVAINDGSRDDTWDWICKSVEDSKGKIRGINIEKNAGKRNAIYQGFLQTSGSVVVTIDSDSIILPDTLKELVSPFVRDRRIGAVAGNVRVLNIHDGIIPKMLDVSFVFSFEFLRSSQSVIRSVFCTPGALSAYRRKVIVPFIDEWRNQLFMGRHANIGEDRAMTNIILREDYDVVFQKGSVVYTEVPVHYTDLCKMLLRWARSNVRENLAMAKFAFKKIDLEDENHLGMQINLVMQTIWMVTPIMFIGTTLYCLFVDPMTFLYSILTVITIWSTIPAFVYASRYSKNEAIWSYIYGMFNFIALSWIGPYAILTMHKSGWLTRTEPKEVSAQPAAATPNPAKEDASSDTVPPS